jgi:hypothetical protein
MHLAGIAGQSDSQPATGQFCEKKENSTDSLELICIRLGRLGAQPAVQAAVPSLHVETTIVCCKTHLLNQMQEHRLPHNVLLRERPELQAHAQRYPEHRITR